MTIIYQLAGCMTLLWGCSYRFANRVWSPPPGIQSVAVESVWDTTHEIVPHQKLWGAMQQAIVENGRLRLTTTESADAQFRMHLSSVKRDQTNPLYTGDSLITPSEDLDQQPSEGPRKFRSLLRSSEYATKEYLELTVLVEVWNLKTRKRIFRKSYVRGSTYNFLETGTYPANQSLRAQEVFEYHFQSLSQTLARQALRDFLRKKKAG